MKQFFITIALFLGINIAHCQTKIVVYEYDDAGNRTKRKTTENTKLKSTGSVLDKETMSVKSDIKGLDDVIGKTDITIYPNPTMGEVVLEARTGNGGLQEVRVELFNAKGELIRQEKFNQTFYVLDITNENAGLYILKLYSDKQVKTYQIIKE